MSAALVLFALRVSIVSAVGIVCGWQPMPDGSESYECIVQVEPRLIDALKHGDSIPVSVEVPEHVQPIRRVRLVFGSGSVPQQLLASAPKKSLEGVVQTQFTTPNNGVMSQNNNQSYAGGQVLPPNAYVTEAQNAFARSLQNGSQAVRSAVSDVAQDILPPEPGRGIADSLERSGQQLGNNLRNASDTVRNDIRQLFSTEAAPENNSEILPPSGVQVPLNQNQPTQQILPADSSVSNNRRRLDQPINSGQQGDWQSRPISEPASASDPRLVQPLSVPNGSVHSRNDSAQTAHSGVNRDDRYSNYAQPHNGGAGLADNRNLETANTGLDSGLEFPPFNPTTGEQSITPTPSAKPGVAEIRRDMLEKPANAEIQGANGLPVGQQPNGQSASAPTAGDFSWNTSPPNQQTAAQPSATQSTSPPIFPLLLSWVLLSGSGAGNLYLFWNYIDVRNKYQELVGDTSRRTGGRRRIRD